MKYLGKLLTVVLILGALAVAVFAETVSAGEKLALLAKPAVVRIYDGYVGTARWEGKTVQKTYKVSYGGAGSGVFVDSNGYIVTNAHVVQATKEGEKEAMKYLLYSFAVQVAKDYNTTVKQFTDQDWAAVEEAFKRTLKFKHIHDVVIANGDSFPFEIKSYGAPAGEGKDVAVLKIEIKNAPILKLGDSDKVRVQDHITVLGYPAAGESDALNEKSLLQASITDGKVSAKKNAADGSTVFEVSAPATHGSSGGPVLNDNGEIVGLMTFRGNTVNGQEVQGFNFVVTSNTVKEFIAQAGASNEGGAVDKTYREGIELYQKQRYGAALEKFEKVQKLFPAHSEIGNLIQDCEIKKETETNYLFWGVVAGAILVALTLGGFLLLTAILVLRKILRKKASPLKPSSATA